MANRKRIALGIYRLEPRGGLEDHCLRVADELSSRGHAVTLLTARSAGAGDHRALALAPILPRLSNYARQRQFAERFAAAVGEGFDEVVAFQPLPGAGIVFCGDVLRNRPVSWLGGLHPRFRAYATLEAKSIAAAPAPRLICVSERQAEAFAARYRLPSDSLAVIPPSLDSARCRPQRAPSERTAAAARLGQARGPTTWLWVGLQPHTKGLDRVLSALAVHPEARLLVAGLQASDRRARSCRQFAEARGLMGRIAWLGYLGRERLLDAFAAADLLVHPARAEAAGATILEAVVNGLPVLVSGVCGFADHVIASGAGRVLPEPFAADELAAALAGIAGPRLDILSSSGVAYGRRAELYTGVRVTADLIEDWTPGRSTPRPAALN